ncbi:MAG: ATP-binding cassette domain-containing protein [Granulosicoccus sp.]|nr:ATP-binding cassette domain-containing protein [Granulosicoccus sp.]
MLELSKAGITLGQREFVFDLSVIKGERVAIVGKSGSGKSTLLNLIGGFLHCQRGEIRWEGRSMLKLTPDQRPVTTLFQRDNLFEHLCVEDNVILGINADLRPTKQQRNLAREALSQVGLSGMEDALPGRLSGGEQQRVALARSLLRRKPVLLLDEPYGALDEGTRQAMLRLTDQITRESDLTVLMVTHQISDAQALDARVVTIDNNKIMACEART